MNNKIPQIAEIIKKDNLKNKTGTPQLYLVPTQPISLLFIFGNNDITNNNTMISYCKIIGTEIKEKNILFKNYYNTYSRKNNILSEDKNILIDSIFNINKKFENCKTKIFIVSHNIYHMTHKYIFLNNDNIQMTVWEEI